MIWLLVLAYSAPAAGAAGKKECIDNVCSCRNGDCTFNQTLFPDRQPSLFCLRGATLSPFKLGATAATHLFAFDEAKVTCETSVIVARASDDTYFSDLFYSQTAEERALAQAQSPTRLTPTFSSLGAVSSLGWWFDASSETNQTYIFSPLYDSCLAVRLPSRASFRSGPVNVVVRFRRKSPRKHGTDVSAGTFEVRAALLLAGALLLIAAGYLARSTAFHYGAGISISMFLGVAILAIFLVQKTTGGRKGTLVSMATFLGYSGALMRWGILYVKTMWAAYWQYILGYVFVFGVIGYFATFYALRSGFVESWKIEMLAQLLRLGACGLLLCALHSARASIGVLMLTLLLWAIPVRLPNLSGLFERSPAPPPQHYNLIDETRRSNFARTAQQMRWEPPTGLGRYMSQAEYELQRDITTERELRALMASPEMHTRLVTAALQGTLSISRSSSTAGMEDDDEDE